MNNIKIVGLGEVVVDWVAEVPRFPKPDEKLDAISENYFSGGVTANYLVAVSRLGTRCGFIGAVGDDDYGDFLIKDFKEEGIDTTHTLKLKNKKTPVNFIFVAKGEKTIIQSPYMKTTKINTKDIKSSYISGAKLLHTTIIHPQITEKAIKIAKKHDVKLSIDLEAQIAERGWKSLEKVLLKADVVILNREGAKKITKTHLPEEAAKKLVNYGIPRVIITIGKEGAIITTSDFQKRIPAFEVEKVIDTTGAGDTFNGAFSVAHWIKGWDLEKSCIFANAAAALKIQKLGARTGMPEENEVLNFLSRRNIDFLTY
ncbi:MAG: putative Ribokinase [Promethearchaeota archaeon]|jgi:ribokinase|nr:MAG: putative Ribokinase [Candidatus Lokiarchaeota archaeon]